MDAKVTVKLSYGQLKRRPGSLTKLADVLAFIETCPEMPSYFFLKYKDDEGDMMTVTSEKEFQEALQLCARQKLLSIEVVAANEKDIAVLKKGEKLPAEDEEPFQIIVPEPGAAESKDLKKEEDNKKPVDFPQEVKPTDKEVAKPNAFISAMDKTVAPVQAKKELTPLEQLDALLATLSKDVTAQFRLTRASFIQELAVMQNPAAIVPPADKPQPQPLNDSKATPATNPTPEAKKESPKKEEKRGSQSDASKPSLLRPSSKYAQQIEELASMGFKVEASEKLLEKYKGSVQKVINVLVTEGN